MKVILSCGGTGGHIYPAIAIADKIREKYSDAQILFIGTKKGMENSLVPAAGYDIKGIDARGFDRRNVLNNVKTVKTVVQGGKEAAAIIKEFAPDIVIGTGGYVTGTVLTAAHRQGIKCCIHEQNAVPGVANKMLSQFVDKVFVSFEGTEKSFAHPNRVVFTGNPIRSDFTKLSREKERRALGLADSDILILAFGGSLGAEILNREVMDLSGEIAQPGIKLYFVTGKRYYEEIKARYDACGIPEFMTLVPYADNMPQLMTASDLVVSRAGAIAVSEITASGKPSVLIPSPNVTNNHQYWNARAVSDAGAAILLEEKNMPAGAKVLASKVLELVSKPGELAVMAEKAKAAGHDNAADIILENLEI